MRVGAMVVGILLAIWTFLEATVIGGFENAAGSEENLAGGGGLVSILCGLAAIMVLAIPLFSAILFGLASLASFVVAGQGYENHYLYGSITALLAVMAFFGWLGKRKERRQFRIERARQEERDARMEQLLQQQARMQASAQIQCPSCNRFNPAETRFCGNCGAALSALSS